MISRTFAPPEQRLKSLITRLKLMPNVLARGPQESRQPAADLHRDRHRADRRQPRFLRHDVPAAFTDVKDAALLAEFKNADDAVIAALEDYKTWLESDLLHRSNGSFAFGADTYAKLLDADEMITTPLPDSAVGRRGGPEAQPAGACRRRAQDRPDEDAGGGAGGREEGLPACLAAAGRHAEQPRRFGTVRPRQADHRPAAGSAGTGGGDAAVPARDDVGFDGYSRAVRKGCDRGVFHSDPARPVLAERGAGRPRCRFGTDRRSATSPCTKCGRDTTCSSSTPRTIRPMSARSSAPQAISRAGRTTANR